MNSWDSNTDGESNEETPGQLVFPVSSVIDEVPAVEGGRGGEVLQRHRLPQRTYPRPSDERNYSHVIVIQCQMSTSGPWSWAPISDPSEWLSETELQLSSPLPGPDSTSGQTESVYLLWN